MSGSARFYVLALAMIYVISAVDIEGLENEFDPYESCPVDVYATCPGCGQDEIEFRDSCYMFSKSAISQPVAKSTCNTEYVGELTDVQDNAEMGFLLRQVASNKHQYWIGLEWENSEWKWLGGRKLSISDWGAGQPDKGSDENCVMHCEELRYKWNDYRCSEQNRYICKRPKENINYCNQVPQCRYTCCSSKRNQICRRCDFTIDGRKRAYKLARVGNSIHCIKMCSWRLDSKFCFPGTCGESCEPKDCVCATRFRNPDNNCMDMDTGPDVLFCSVEVSISGSMQKRMVTCTDNGRTHTAYVNFPANRISLETHTEFHLNYTEHGKPYFVYETKVGILRVNSNWALKDRNGASRISGELNCDDYSRDTPNTGVHVCNIYSSIAQPGEDGDSLDVNAAMLNGGYQILYNFDNGDPHNPTKSGKKYFRGNRSERQLQIYFDFKAPYHCSVKAVDGLLCEDPYLNILQSFLSKDTFHVDWKGWNDSLAGIYEYRLEVYPLLHKGRELQMDKDPVLQYTYNKETTRQIVTLKQNGVFAIILSVEDKTANRQNRIQGNTKYAKKIIIVDDKPKVTIFKEKFLVQSAWLNTSRRWLTDLKNKVVFSWNGTFCNGKQHTGRWLDGIANDPRYPIDQGYEDTTWVNPPQRSVRAVPNKCAIVRYEIQWRSDGKGERGINNPSESKWITLEDNLDEIASLDIPRADGNTIQIFVRAYDILNTSAVESIKIYVDSTPPEISNISICSGGVCNLTTLNSEQLTDMQISFKAYDFHSALLRLHYEIHDAKNASHVIFAQQVSLKEEKQASCSLPHCTCVPATGMCQNNSFTVHPEMILDRDRHYTDGYILLVHATNNAKLQSFARLEIKLALKKRQSHDKAGKISRNKTIRLEEGPR